MTIAPPTSCTYAGFSWHPAEEVVADATRLSGLAHAAAVQSEIQCEATDAAMELMGMCRADHRETRLPTHPG